MTTILSDSWNGRLGREYQNVYFELMGNDWRVHECNYGPSGIEFFGKEDNEWWIDIAPSEQFKFTEYLLKKVMNGTDRVSLATMKGELKEEGIFYDSGCW